MRLPLHVLGDLLPVPEAKLLDSVQQLCVFLDRPLIILQHQTFTSTCPSLIFLGLLRRLGEHREISIVGEMIVVVVLMVSNLHSTGEALQAQVEVLALSTGYPKALEII